MAPVIPCSVCSVSLIPGNTFPVRKSRYIARFNCSTKSIKQSPLLSQRFYLPFPTTVGIFPRCRTECVSQYGPRITRLSATGTDLIAEEQDLPPADEVSVGSSEEPSTSSETIEDLSSAKSDTISSPAPSKRPRAARRSDMPPVKKEDLVPGATFTGKVRSILPFGAFVDFGAFTDGLVHVSRISDNFVKDVANFVSVGQEVKVRLVEVNNETGRISLSMRDIDETGRQTQTKDASSSSSGEKGKSSRNSKGNQRKVESKKASKYFEGQDLSGIVKNKIRSGAFVTLPEGEEGFLPVSEESDDNGPNVMDGSSLEIGQEVNVRVLRISRGKVTLTMKVEKDSAKSDEEINVGTVHFATNPFVLAFRKNKDISVFLDEREKLEDGVDESSQTRVEEATKSSDHVVVDGEDKSLSDGNETEVIGDEKLEVEAAQSPGIEEEEIIKTTGQVVEDDEQSSLVEKEIEASVAEKIEVEATQISEAQEEADTKGEQLGQTIESKVEEATKAADQVVASGGDLPLSVGKDIETSAAEKLQAEAVDSLEIDNEKTVSATDQVVVDSEYKSSLVDSEIEASVDEKLDVAQSPETEQEATTEATVPVVVDGEDKSSLVENEIGVSVDGKLDVAQSPETEQEATVPVVGGEDKSSFVEYEIGVSVDEKLDGAQSPETEKEATVPVVVNGEAKSSFVENEIGANVDEKVEVEATQTSETKQEAVPVASSIGSAAEVTLSETTAKAISSALVKQLREETGAGMMDCKKALSEAGGDLVKAQEFLRKKGLASADKKASRTTAEGRIESYIHDSRIGVLIEVNCETDFVSRGDIFKELVNDLAMQVAACPRVEYLVPEDVPKETVEKEREIEMQKEDLLSRPEQIRGKIVDGRIKKRLDELALLEQPYIKNDKVLVKDWVKQTIATIGENIKVKRFVKYNLGEGLEKKSQDFAAEVAAQTTAKSVPASPTIEQPATAEPENPAESIPKVAVSAAMVKQLREETGAGMMDCKKALSETGGDLVKAQEYLRKKGLSTADKKSGRLAAEGRIGSYIHDSRIGVLLEVNCETDFVGRSEKFKELVDDLAMQVAACSLVKYVSVEDIPEDIRNKEKEIEMQREDILSKPESIREKIVEGRVAKRLGELALLEQPFIKDDSVLVKDLVKQTVAAIGENIKVRRFARFTLGENTEKETEAEAQAAGEA